MSKHANEVKVLMDLFAKYNGRMTPAELLSNLKETKMRQVYDYLYWANREQGIVFKTIRNGRTAVAYEHVSGSAQNVPTPTITAKLVVVKSPKPAKAVAKAAAKKAKPVKKAKALKTEVSKPVTKPVVEKVRKGEVASYSVDPDFDSTDPLAIPDFLKR